jgi:hypothetical protein
MIPKYTHFYVRSTDLTYTYTDGKYRVDNMTIRLVISKDEYDIAWTKLVSVI